ncbi:MAG TPA: AAA family ATPase [Spirochaetales bacterium]|nr:AAA family ATPase [Spirochaetales bacterium]
MDPSAVPGVAPITESELSNAAELSCQLQDELRKIIRGKSAFLSLLVSALLSGGHVLIQDLPGLGKTTVAKTVAALISGKFRRIQGTPDLLPYDITGVDVFNPETRTFDFNPGPVFAHVLLADELNRTTPKVQSALLEAMAEGQVTVGLKTHLLPDFFFVIATQNTVDREGTYSLPLAQMDRFMMRLSIGYPDPDSEFSILAEDPGSSLPFLRPLYSIEELLSARRTVSRIYTDSRVIRIVENLLLATRSHPGVSPGVSPRGGLMLLRAARGYALIQGRGFVTDEDIAALAVPVLAHRIRVQDVHLSPEAFIQETILRLIKGKT